MKARLTVTARELFELMREVAAAKGMDLEGLDVYASDASGRRIVMTMASNRDAHGVQHGTFWTQAITSTWQGD